MHKIIFIHFHGASIGEAKSNLKVFNELNASKNNLQFVYCFSYTSDRAISALSSLKGRDNVHFINLKEHKTNLAGHIDLICSNYNIEKKVLIIAEKDYYPHLIGYYTKSKSYIINIDAKPPRSILSRILFMIARPYDKYNKIYCDTYNTAGIIESYISSANNKAENIKIVGSLKARRTISHCPNYNSFWVIVYLSMRYEECASLVQIIDYLKRARKPLMHIIIPAYGQDIPSKRNKYNRFFKKISKMLPDIESCDSVGDFNEHIYNHRIGNYIYTKTGDVDSILRYAKVAVVGGTLNNSTLSKGRGHNVYEPLSFAIPTLVGESYINWRNIYNELIDAEILFSGKTNEISQRILELVGSHDFYLNNCMRILNASNLQKGVEASSIIAKDILSMLG